MALPELTDNLNVIQSLPNQPAMNADELKRAFDDAVNKIKTYTNETLLPALNRNLADLQNTDTSLSSRLNTTNTTVSENANTLSQAQLNKIYPVGAIYMSTANTNPSSLFGGTWTRIKDRFLLACCDTYANNKTGGSANHTHTNPTSGSTSGTTGSYSGITGNWNGTSGSTGGTTGSTSGTTGSYKGTTGSYSGNTGSTSGTTGSTGGTTGSYSGNTGNTSGTTGSTTLTKDQIPAHSHTGTTGIGKTPSMRAVSGAGANYAANHVVGYNSTSSYKDYSNDSDDFPTANHYHTFTTDNTGGGKGHTHSIPSHNHTIPSHTHSIPEHTHSMPSHNHSIPSHTHSIPEHTHSMPSHTHSIPNHTHTLPSHNHSIPSHTHSIPAHTHTIGNTTIFYSLYVA